MTRIILSRCRERTFLGAGPVTACRRGAAGPRKGRRFRFDRITNCHGAANCARLAAIQIAVRSSAPMHSEASSAPSRRDLLALIGTVAGSAAMYEAMTALGFASESGYKSAVRLDGDPKGASVLILGAGLAGMPAALELRKAGYRVQLLEFNSRPGGRNWTLRGGDSFVELGGIRQTCDFEQGLYLNPGPWRIPYHQDRKSTRL